MRHILFLAVLSCGLAACPGADSNPQHALLYTGLEGTVLLPDGVTEVEVCAYQMGDSGISAKPEGCATSDARGFWTIKGGSLSDSIYVVAKADDSEFRLSATATNVEQYEQAASIHIHPISHLTAGYALYLLRHETAANLAVDQARKAINAHFGGVAHHEVQAWTAPDDTVRHHEVLLTNRVKAYLFTAGLDTLARQMSADAKIAENTTITGSTVLAYLYDDIVSDGVFDGVGSGGVALGYEQIGLSEHTLRLNLAVAIAQFLQSPANRTTLTAAHVKPLLESVAASQGRIFPNVGPSYQESKPQLSSCSVIRADGQISSLDYPQRKIIELRCLWSDLGDLRTGTVSIENSDNAGALTQIKAQGSLVSANIDTLRLVDKTSYNLIITAENKFGVISTVNASLTVQNEPMTVALEGGETSWMRADEPLRVVGQASSPVRKVTITPDELPSAVQEYSFESSSQHFSLDYAKEMTCGHSYTVHVKIEDWAGGTVSRTLTVLCDRTAPDLYVIPSYFTQDASGSTISLTDWNEGNPRTFEKFYTMLDYVPEHNATPTTQNLPILKFSVHDYADDEVGVETPALKVEYSYAMGHNPSCERSWTRLSSDEQGVFELPLSYQTLLPRASQTPNKNFIARCKSADEHRIIIRITDLAGNTKIRVFPFYFSLLAPSVQVSSCGPTGALEGAQLMHPNFDVVYSRGFDLFDAMIHYPLNLPEGTIAPSSDIFLNVEATTLESKVTKIKRSYALPRDHGEYVDSERSMVLHQAAKKDKTCKGAHRIGFEGGGCEDLSQTLNLPDARIIEDLHASNQKTSFAVYFGRQSISLDNDSTFLVSSDSSYLVRTRMDGDFFLQDGRRLSWSNRVPDFDGTIAVELQKRIGVELGSKPGRILSIRDSVAGVEMTRPPLRVRFVKNSDGGLPNPISIKVDESCASFLQMRWDLTQAPPFIGP